MRTGSCSRSKGPRRRSTRSSPGSLWRRRRWRCSSASSCPRRRSPGLRCSRSCPAIVATPPTRPSHPTAPPAPTACASCWTRPTAATATRSSTAPTAARASRSSARSRTTARSRRWPAFRCATAVAPSTTIRAIAASTPSPTRALCAGHRWRWSTRSGCRRRCMATTAWTSSRRPLARWPTGRSSRSRGSAAITWRAVPTTRRRSRRCEHASTARTSRSR